ncbi:MAG: ABC-type Fe3+-hydroxamate transport system substrate-binding protein [Flavobacteriaceae bacterium]|jgi:ABC-type Fe3+-hydroxamate transport system substrate-binding protein
MRRSFQDQVGEDVELNFPPKRIISLVPSITEYLIDIGAPVIGRTKFCVHPAEEVKEIQVIGGTKNFRLEAIDHLQPDLIIGNKEENYQEGIQALKSKYPVWISDIYTIHDALVMMKELALIVDKEANAKSIIQTVENRWQLIHASQTSKRVLYLIWRDPWMVAGKQTYIDSMLNHIGNTNACVQERYPAMEDLDISNSDVDVIMLSSEPYPFRQKHIQELKELCPYASIQLANGEFYSWYGTRVLKANP